MTFSELMYVLNCKVAFDIADNDKIIGCEDFDINTFEDREIEMIYPCDSKKSINNRILIKLR